MVMLVAHTVTAGVGIVSSLELRDKIFSRKLHIAKGQVVQMGTEC
jgi:hypothetical protein